MTPRWIKATSLVFVVVFAGIGPAAAQDQPQGRTPSLDALKAGLQQMDTGELDDAYQSFDRARQWATNSELRFQANLGMASAASSLGRLVDAEAAYRRALEIHPDHAEALYSYALLLKEREAFADAAAYFARAAVRDPDFLQAYVELGIVYAQLGRHAESAKACQRVIERKPDDTGALTCLGVASYHLGLLPEARQFFDQVLERDLYNANARYGLGLVLLYLEDRDGAIREYAVLKELDPDLARDLYERIFPSQ